ncbi:hypothetical protein BGX26_003356 [Mortierella sp. AD094]|nr:hypothetical protein BGX26_003356 [Mortierella sp. AD094]
MSEVEIANQDVGCIASLERMLSPMRVLATTVSVTSVMTGIVPLTQTALGAGGPVMIVFGFAFASLMASSIALSMADIASGFPYVKGGLIEYSRRLAPPKLRGLSSWVVGWLHFFAFVSATRRFNAWLGNAHVEMFPLIKFASTSSMFSY